ncbi:cell division protein FtsZ [Rhodospirillaceae bacterium KN72]|uniref:Cell division protein FtsZ n=1 Tax=Pacificispira spongiicola TaxID=2729598 RepID=A0A7Y0DZU9_9PROT|nr:cell division protein FtsZ [Pacificispira spongiicola]NMM44538.1 cell division protein FtsZ [Pacificispira spongiicola]
MSINFMAPEADADLKPRIIVVGVGGAGGNAVNNMIRSNLEGVEFVVANTDAQALKHSQADRKIQLGHSVTQGLGAGARPEIGREAAIETLEESMEFLKGANMVFFTAGMGGGTGTGAAPVLAEACRDAGMLTVGVVTKPFHFEGAHRMRAAEQGIEELQSFVDTLIIIPNQNLFRVANEKTTFADAFKMADDVLYSGVRGVTDLMVMPGLINLDFADIRTVMSEMGKAMMGTGEAEGDNRAILAAESAISNPLLEDVSMKGARGVLINITGGPDMTLFEVDEAANRIREEVDADANIIFGSTFDENLEGMMRVSVVATGIESEAAMAGRPVSRASVTPLRPRKLDPVAEDIEIAASATMETVDAPEMDADPYDDAVAYDDTAAATADYDTDAYAEPAAAEDAVGHEEPARETGLFDNLTQPEATTAEGVQEEAEVASAPDAPQTVPEPVRPKDAFIPPRPVRPEELKRGPARAAEPFREADLMNAGETEARPTKSKPSLFSRAIGLGLGGSVGHKTAPSKPAEPQMIRPAQATAQQATPKPEPAMQRPAAPQQAAQTAAAPQHRPAEADLAPSKADEEMLEIPAFLRRQAN